MLMRNLTFLLTFLLPTFIYAASPANVKIGVILDLNSPIGLTSRAAINLAVSDYYSSHPNSTTHLSLLFRHSPADVISAAYIAVDLLVDDKVQAIIGPQSSPEAAFVADLGTKAHVPVLAFSATSPSLSLDRSRYLIRTSPSDAAQAAAVAAVVAAYDWRRAVLMYQDDDYGASLVPAFIDALSAVDAAVPYRSAIAAAASDDHILAELYRLTTLQTRVFIIHANSTFAPRLLALAASAGMMEEEFAWIATAAVTCALDKLDHSVTGVLAVKPYFPISSEFKKRWRKQFFKDNSDATIMPEMSNFGVWAYDSVTSLAMAVKEVGLGDAMFDSSPLNNNHSTKLSEIGVARYGHKLLESILQKQFNGVGGRFRVEHGERNVTVFEVVNVINKTEKNVGFWTARYGLTRQVNWTSNDKYSATRAGLRKVLWPGEVRGVPRGWVQPVAGRKLIIAVPGPVESGFHAFLNVSHDPVRGKTVASGFVIDVFEAAVAELPYALLFEYVEHNHSAGNYSQLVGHNHSAGNYSHYTQLVEQVYYEKFDAVVGDVTITFDRSRYVDFTLPYTETGVSMVVPVKVRRSKDAWIFLKPLTTDLWVVSCAFFIFTGGVVWILEHRINEEFRGPPSHQIGTAFYFSFSTLVYAHKETVMSNLSRIVVTIWVFVVFILQSSYVASLTSMLTVQRLHPTVTDINELIRNNEPVGYLADSFVRGFLIEMGFNDSQLKPYRSPQEYEKALRNGTDGGGVAAVIDEIPYLKVFLGDYCDNYTMAGLNYTTAGFGFAFPKGSPIVPDLSRAILDLTEGEKMIGIEKKWLGDQSNCPNQGSKITSSNSLDFASFWGLFLITGIASLAALLYYLVTFLYRHRDILKRTELQCSTMSRIRTLARVFDEKDLSYHTFKKAEQKEGSVSGIGDHTPPSHINGSESPFSISNLAYEGGSPLTTPASPIVEVPCIETSKRARTSQSGTAIFDGNHGRLRQRSIKI